MQIQKFKPLSSIIDAEYKIPIYERQLQLSDVQAPLYNLFLRIAQASLPEGIMIDVDHHSTDEEERRYVPDKDLLELRTQLDDMGGPVTAKKK